MTSYINGDAGNQERSSRWRFLFETGEMMLLNNEPEYQENLYFIDESEHQTKSYRGS